MSNYVNNVDVNGSIYALGPLMSTPSGGIVDNINSAYSSRNNCIIHTSLLSAYANINNTLMLNASVQAPASYVNDTCIIGGRVTISGSNCDTNMFIGCDIRAGFIASKDIAGTNTFIGVDTPYISIHESMLLCGAPNLVQGYTNASFMYGYHATATETVRFYSYSSAVTGMRFPQSAAGLYHITVATATSPMKWCSIDAPVINRVLDTTNLYSYSSFYYASSASDSSAVGISVTSTGYLHLSARVPFSAVAQVTVSYDVLPYSGSGSGY